jgi:hypothetical protein
MRGFDQVTSQVEQVVNGCMDTQEFAGLFCRLQTSHPTFPHPGWCVRLFYSIVGILGHSVNGLGDQFTMSDAVTSQFNCNDSPGFVAMASQKPLKEALCSGAIPAALKKHVHHVSVLVDRAPQIVLLAVDLDEDFIDKKCIAISLMLALQSLGAFGTEIDTPEPNGFAGHDNPALGE